MLSTVLMATATATRLGKLSSLPHVETVGIGAKSKRLHIRDRVTGRPFLIDTGSDISILPFKPNAKAEPEPLVLFAANNTRVSTFGRARLVLNLGLRRNFTWNFCLAAVPYPIIGADLLAHYGLLPDLRHHRLMDPLTGLSTNGYDKSVCFSSISTIDRSSKFTQMLTEFPGITGLPQAGTKPSSGVCHHILTRGPPTHERARRLDPQKLAAAKAQFRHDIENGICRPSSSPWASPIHLTRKNNGQWRICGDYRRLNAMTIPDRYPVPHLHDFTANLHRKSIFSKIDLIAAYQQIPIAPEDVQKTAVITPFGLFEYLVMTYGLRNAGQTFQRYVHQALGDLDFVFSYIDDILIASLNEEEHERHLRVVFERLQQYSMRINLEKCQFGKSEIEFLGHVVNGQGVKPTPEKVKAITDYPLPSTICDLRRFLGMVNFYRRSLPHAAHTQAPLNQFLHESRKNDKRKIQWDSDSEAAFHQIKTKVASIALLTHPVPEAETRLVSDASDTGIGAVLEQFVDRAWRPLAFFSRQLNKAQQNYSAYDRELTAIHEAIKYFRYFLEGRAFKIVTDHKPLVYAFLQRSEKASPRQQRQLSYISQFSTTIEHLPGSENVVADTLSRASPVPDPRQPNEHVDAVSHCALRVESILLPTQISLSELAEAQQLEPELLQSCTSSKSSLNVKKIVWGAEKTSVYCDLAGDTLRPVVPTVLRKRIFDIFHTPAHPSAKLSNRVISQKYVWPSMHKDITKWAKSCLDCQRSKVTRHTILRPAHFVAPESRFRHVHMDIVGPLPEYEGYRYLLTIVDRFSRWPEAIPLRNIESSTVCRAFYDGWIARFGTPETLSTDQGRQFESSLARSLLSLLGCHKIRTTPYHPSSNGMIERFHRSLKAAIMCHATLEWTRVLSTIMLGLRTNVLDCGSSPAEYLYGTTLRIPGEFVQPEGPRSNPQSFVEEFRLHIKRIKPIPVEHHDKRKIFIFKELSTCSHVFLRVGVSRRSLEPPYSGPHKVLNRPNDRIIEIDVDGTAKTVSLENVKPAHMLRDPAFRLHQSISPTTLVTNTSRVTGVEPATFVTPHIQSENLIPQKEIVNDRGSQSDPIVNKDVNISQPHPRSQRHIPNILRSSVKRKVTFKI